MLDANGALVLAAVGLLLICAEFCLPGWVVPGVAGGVCLICGAYRLSLLDANVAAATGLVLAVAVAASAGYGLLPEWAGWMALLCVPFVSRLLVPAGIHWAAAALATLPPMAAFVLLRVAARALANKTLLQ